MIFDKFGHFRIKARQNLRCHVDHDGADTQFVDVLRGFQTDKAAAYNQCPFNIPFLQGAM